MSIATKSSTDEALPVPIGQPPRDARHAGVRGIPGDDLPGLQAKALHVDPARPRPVDDAHAHEEELRVAIRTEIE